jgi:Carboxypeptidase regulatory-like domain
MEIRTAQKIRRTLSRLALVISVSVSNAWGAQSPANSGTIEVTVVVRNSEGARSYIPAARVQLSGPTREEGTTDTQGKYTFKAVGVGKYEIQATFPGFDATRSLALTAGETEKIELELKPTEVQDSVTVTANDQEKPQPAPSGTIHQETLRDAPNADQRFESVLPLIPGVVRGPDGRINLKGARSTQSGALVNSANVTDPATGNPAINVPIDVVSSVQVISNPYDPQYGKLSGAVSTVETKTGNYDKFHLSMQNFVPRPRVRDGSVMGIGSTTPRVTFTGPLVANRIAITQALEYRYIRTPVNSLPAGERDTKLESFDSFTQIDSIISSKQTATVSVAFYPQKLDFFGLNTFTPQPSTPDFHQRGYQVYAQDRYLTGEQSLLISQFSFKKFDADVTPQSNEPYRLLPDTTEGGFFSRQARRTSRVEWQETYQFAPFQFLGEHEFKAGFNFAHSAYDGRQAFLTSTVADASDTAIERISFTQPTSFDISQNEASWFAGDQWAVVPRFTISLGLRFDHDTITQSTHAAPRAGFLLALTGDSKTLLKGGVGIFYDRVPLMIPVFEELPDRTVTLLGPGGQDLHSTAYVNTITERLRNPRSTSWNLELDRQLRTGLLLRVAYEQRTTTRDFVVSPVLQGSSEILGLSNRGSDSYKEFQVTARYQLRGNVFNASYIRSRAFGDLNDFNQFFGTLAQPVIQLDARGRLPFDAPNRFLLWGTIAGPWKLTLVPVYDLHTGFPYSVQNEFREYVGPRNVQRFPRFSSFDIQLTRPLAIHFHHKHLKARAGIGIFNAFNHFNPRDVQTNLESAQFGGFFNNAWREYRGKFVLEF